MGEENLRECREVPFELLVRLEGRLRAVRQDVAAGQQSQWVGLGFRIGERWLVAPQDDVREVIMPPSLTRVPAAQPWLLGLANVRGSLLPICDLRRIVGEEHRVMDRRSRVLVLNSERVPAGFLVDEVVGYRQFAPQDQRRDSPDSGSLAPYLLGAFVRDGQPWLAFSLHKVVGSDTFGHAAG
jgi:twitching motility protein PilI